MKFFWNDKKVSKEKLLKKLNDDKTVIQKLTLEFPNEHKTDEPPTMEGFDIPKEMILELAQRGDELGGEVTATFTNCGKLGGKTLVITVK